MYKLCLIDLESCNVLRLEINQEVDDRYMSPHGVQQKMCRDILLTFSFCGIMVAPQRNLDEILVVGRSDCFSDEATNFQSWLTKEAITVKSTNRADCLSVEECFRFSIFVWLEPYQYYRCGNDLIKGPFLRETSSKQIRILFAVHCTSVGDVFLRVSPETIRLYPLKAWQVQSCSEEPRWVFCLPKLGRGQVVEQYSRLPSDSAFTNYVEMRAYWKNCYGYDLPLEEPETYYSVLFKGFRSSFIYPDFCVLSSEPQAIRFREEYDTTLAALDEFSQALTSRKRFICMEEIKLSVVDRSSVSLSCRSLGVTAVKRRRSYVTRLPKRFAPVSRFKGDIMADTGETSATDSAQRSHAARTQRDRKRFIDVD